MATRANDRNQMFRLQRFLIERYASLYYPAKCAGVSRERPMLSSSTASVNQWGWRHNRLGWGFLNKLLTGCSSAVHEMKLANTGKQRLSLPNIR
jgi:hypothetical protein